MKQLMLLFCLCVFNACGDTQIEFEKSGWSQRSDFTYTFRESMVEDLMENHLEAGMTYEQVTDLLGEPETLSHSEENTIGYTIMEDYGWDIDPVERKSLMIQLTADSLVQDFRVSHWKK